MTPNELASRLGVTRQYVYQLVSGESLPSLELALRIEGVLKVPVSNLWELTEGGYRARATQNRRR